MEKLQTELIKGYKSYYDELNAKVAEELLHQESLQKEIHDKLEKYTEKSVKIGKKINKRNSIKLLVLEKLNETKQKALIFRFLNKFLTERTIYKSNKSRVMKITEIKLKRKLFDGIKKISVLEKTNAYEQKIKMRTENELIRVEDSLKKQQEDLWILIAKAEEKLKHENRKKVQAKLQLDQIVLRGVSALSLQALALSQNSLNGI
jgi:hypothetical protein